MHLLGVGLLLLAEEVVSTIGLCQSHLPLTSTDNDRQITVSTGSREARNVTDERSQKAADAAIARAIVALRTQERLTQEEFAIHVGMSRSSVATAETSTPSPGLLAAVSRKYPDFAGVADDYLRQRPGRRKPKIGAETDEVEDMFFSRSNVNSALLGVWHALWETSIDGIALLNSEVLEFEAGRRNRVLVRNLEISPENPEGGYMWRGDCRMYDAQFLLGTYVATERSIRSKGVLQLALSRSGREIEGQWAGASFDSDFAHGLVVMTRNAENTSRTMEKFRNTMRMR